MPLLDFAPPPILAENLSFADYLWQYAEQFAEFEDGVVLKMSPVSIHHDKITSFVGTMFRTYMDQTHAGEVLAEPFVMKLFEERRGREPDLLVVLNEHLDRLHETVLNGAADLVVEVVSPESIERDRGTKFREYQAAGVREYWILDPIHRECLFYILNEEGVYQARPPDAEGFYTSQVLPKLKFDVNLILRDPPPTISEAFRLIEHLFAGENP